MIDLLIALWLGLGIGIACGWWIRARVDESWPDDDDIDWSGGVS